MQLEITPELAQLRPVLRRFTEEVLEPIALEIDRTGAVPAQTVPLLRQQGYLGMRLPQAFGGGGLGDHVCFGDGPAILVGQRERAADSTGTA